jgi:hypothetical protein
MSKWLVNSVDHQSLVGFVVVQRIRLNIVGIAELLKVDEKADSPA